MPDALDKDAVVKTFYVSEITRLGLENEKLAERLYELETNNDFSYQIDKDLFLRCILALKKYWKFSDKVYDSIKLNLFEIPELETLINCFEHLLENCCNDNKDISDISYFMYDLEFGNKYEPGCVTENGRNIDFSDEEKLWEYVYKNKLKKRKFTNFDNIKKMNKDELADYINSVFMTGVMVGQGLISKEDCIDYKKWLDKEVKI